jgi:cellulose biosynthesis protein BcsE
MTPTNLPEYRLGVPGLPLVLDSMIAGGLYGVQTASPPARAALVAHCLEAALPHTSATLVTNGAPERIVGRGGSSGKLGQSLQSRQLQVFRLRESASKNIFRHGPSRFARELDYFQVPENALVVFDGADDLFTLQDSFVVAEQARVYRDWMRQRGGCGVLVFSQLSYASQFSAAYQTLLDHLDGAVRLESGRERFDWIVDFWASPSGMVASETLSARIESNGSLQIFEGGDVGTPLGVTSTTPQPLLPAIDESDVYYMDSTLIGLSKQLKGKWVLCDSLVGLLHAARKAQAATVILVYDHGTDLRQLAQVAHTLRVSLGKKLRIIVRELNSSLRYQNELLLIRLGVNMVIHRDVPVSRLALVLESIKGQFYEREIDVDFDVAIDSVTPSKAIGFVAPNNFFHEVSEMVGRSEALGVPYGLVRIKPPQNMPANDAVGQFKLTRAGDIVTATDKGHVLLFMHACPQASILPTLERIGGQSIQTTFPDMEFAVGREEAVDMLAQEL